jgi:mannose-6-phosphate isomerase-like protein (cupin superfamily)
MMNFYKYNTTESRIFNSKTIDLYQYRVYIGPYAVSTDIRNSYWYIDGDRVISKTGNDSIIDSKLVCIEIFGYTPEERTSSYSRYTDLPYINGCSSKQLISPNRLGDPTWQLLLIPPYTSEQAHHIHSTARVVYVLGGSGTSHIGQGSQVTEISLEAGSVIILDKMVPHHFSTQEQHLVVLPLHIFSSTELEYSHPMFNGTHKI